MEKLIEVAVALIVVIVMIAMFGMLLAFPIMWCWNYAVVTTFGLPMITWGQAWCLNFICAVLLKNASK